MKKLTKTLTLGALILSTIPSNVFAETKTATINATIEESLSLTLSNNAINLDLTSPELMTGNITVTGKTNSANGYTISFNTNNNYNDLKHTNAQIDEKIASIRLSQTEADFPEKSWGYSVGDGIFKEVPIAPKNIFATSTIGQNSHAFTVGAKGSSNLVAGDYENELLFTIVGNPIIPSSDEELVYDGKARAILGANGNLNFVYNENTYTVGETYMDNRGETEIIAVYNVPINTSATGSSPRDPWHKINVSQITNVNFDESFKEFKPTSIAGWFYNFRTGTIDGIENLDTSMVTDMSYAFDGMGAQNGAIDLDLSGLDMSNVRNTEYMFYGIGKYSNSTSVKLDLSNWNTGNIENAQYMFDDAAYSVSDVTISGLSSWDTGNIKNMEGMFYWAFYDAQNIDLNLDNWDVSSVTNMKNVFYNFGKSADNVKLSINNWKARNAEVVEEMFYGVGGSGSTSAEISADNFYIGKATDLSYMINKFGCTESCPSNSSVKISMKNFSAPKAENIEGAFRGAGDHSNNITIDAPNWDLPSAISTQRTFREVGEYSQNVYIDISNWNTENVTNMSYMFETTGCYAGTLYINTTGLDIDNVSNMENMFLGTGREINWPAPIWYNGER